VDGDVVYGMVYTLEKEGEENLDLAEGAPFCYVKRDLDITLLSIASEPLLLVEREIANVKVKALVYVDEVRTGEGICREEYVARMNRGIRDAMGKGMPGTYVKSVLRKWVREEEVVDNRDLRDPFHPIKQNKEVGTEGGRIEGD